MKKLRIWHAKYHDEFTTSEIPFNAKLGLAKQAQSISDDGGFYDGQGWVPYHRINYMEIIESQ